MAGSLIEMQVKGDQELDKQLADIEARAGNQKPAWQLIGEIILSSTLRRFETHSDPEGRPWLELSPAYAAWKASHGYDPTNILILHLYLLRSLHWEAGDNRVTVGTDVIYAAIHQLGGTITRGGITIEIPERPYLGVTDEDWASASRALGNYIVSGSLS